MLKTLYPSVPYSKKVPWFWNCAVHWIVESTTTSVQLCRGIQISLYALFIWSMALWENAGWRVHLWMDSKQTSVWPVSVWQHYTTGSLLGRPLQLTSVMPMKLLLCDSRGCAPFPIICLPHLSELQHHVYSPVSQVPGQHLQQEQVPALLQTQGVAFCRGLGGQQGRRVKGPRPQRWPPAGSRSAHMLH